MFKPVLSRWTPQSAVGELIVATLIVGFGSLRPAAQQGGAAPSAQAVGTEACKEGFFGSPEKGCTDVNECATANGGCHKLASCQNTPGSRLCGACPQDFQGDGYVGCF